LADKVEDDPLAAPPHRFDGASAEGLLPGGVPRSAQRLVADLDPTQTASSQMRAQVAHHRLNLRQLGQVSSADWTSANPTKNRRHYKGSTTAGSMPISPLEECAPTLSSLTERHYLLRIFSQTRRQIRNKRAAGSVRMAFQSATACSTSSIRVSTSP